MMADDKVGAAVYCSMATVTWLDDGLRHINAGVEQDDHDIGLIPHRRMSAAPVRFSPGDPVAGRHVWEPFQ